MTVRKGGWRLRLPKWRLRADWVSKPTCEDCQKPKIASQTDAQLFSESNSRYIVEVEPKNYNSFAKLMLNLPFGQIAKVTDTKNLVIKDLRGQKVINAEINSLKQAWQKTFAW